MRAWTFLALGTAIALAACVQPKPKQKANLADNLSPDCYTVDLFDPYQIEYPAADVPPEARKFLGVWKNGAWNGNWCHDLYVTRVYSDGRVEVIDTHGPNPNSGIDATAFKRTGRIQNGELYLQSNGVTVRYRIVDDFLLGSRTDIYGDFVITLSREDGLAQVPVPPIKPVRRG